VLDGAMATSFATPGPALLYIEQNDELL